MLTIEGILALYHSCMASETKLLCSLPQCHHYIEISYSRKFNWGIFPTCTLSPDSTSGDDHISPNYIKVDASAGSHSYEGVCSTLI